MTTPTRSFRLSTEALRKLERLATRNCRSQAQQLTHMIEESYKEITMDMDIDLIEDNAGGLFAGNEELGWWLVGDTGTTFTEDAPAIAAGDTGDWTIEHTDVRPIAPTVAIWRDGRVFATADLVGGGQPGNAASAYIG